MARVFSAFFSRYSGSTFPKAMKEEEEARRGAEILIFSKTVAKKVLKIEAKTNGSQRINERSTLLSVNLKSKRSIK